MRVAQIRASVWAALSLVLFVGCGGGGPEPAPVTVDDSAAVVVVEQWPVTEAVPIRDAWHLPAGETAPQTCEGAADAATELLRDSGASVPVVVWRDTLATRVVGDPADMAEMLRILSAAVDTYGEMPRGLESWPTGWDIEACTAEAATVGVHVTDGETDVRTVVDVVWRDDEWVMVAPSGGTFIGRTTLVSSQ